MRRPRRILGPTVLAAGLVLTACSEEVDGTASPASTAPSSSSSSSGSSSSSPMLDPELEQFCTDGKQVFTEVGSALNAAVDMGVEPMVDALQQTVDAFDAVTPPEEIAEDWSASQDGFADLRDTVAAVDPSAPDAQAQVDAVLDGGETTVGPAFERVGDWIDQNCPNG